MAELKTKETGANVADFIEAVPDQQKREDSKVILKMMEEITGKPAKMWGPSIIGFDNYHYKYGSGREGDFLITGFSPRKTTLTLYLMAGFHRYEDLMSRLGKYKTGKSCLYVKVLSDIDMEVLRELISESVAHIRTLYR